LFYWWSCCRRRQSQNTGICSSKRHEGFCCGDPAAKVVLLPIRVAGSDPILPAGRSRSRPHSPVVILRQSSRIFPAPDRIYRSILFSVDDWVLRVCPWRLRSIWCIFFFASLLRFVSFVRVHPAAWLQTQFALHRAILVLFLCTTTPAIAMVLVFSLASVLVQREAQRRREFCIKLILSDCFHVSFSWTVWRYSTATRRNRLILCWVLHGTTSHIWSDSIDAVAYTEFSLP
jgi:hypothetical protein